MLRILWPRFAMVTSAAAPGDGRGLVFTESPRELPPGVEAPQAPCQRIGPGDPGGASEVRACQPARKRERSVDAPGTEAPPGCRQCAKACPRAETEGIANQRDEKRRQQRSRNVPVRSQDEFAKT